MTHDKSLVGQARTAMAEGDRVFAGQVTNAQQAVHLAKQALDALPALQAALNDAVTALGQVGTNLPQTDVTHYQQAIAAAAQSKTKLTEEAANLEASVRPVVTSLNVSIPQIMTALGNVQQQFGAGVRTGDAALGHIQNS